MSPVSSSDVAYQHRGAGPSLDSRTRILNAALRVVRTKGYASTTVDDICREAELTKGSFFHHFASKDDLALAAIGYWESVTDNRFQSAAYQAASDPLARLMGYLDFRQQILHGEPQDYTCLLGTLVQETHSTHPALRAACEAALASHVARLTVDLAAAKKVHAPRAKWDPEDIAYYIQAVLQGSFIFAKARQSPHTVRTNLEHVKRYVASLFDPEPAMKSKPAVRRARKS